MKKLKRIQWYWLTDETPHKVLPMKKTRLKHIIKNPVRVSFDVVLWLSRYRKYQTVYCSILTQK